MIKLVNSFFLFIIFLLFVIGATAAETEKIVIDELVFLPLAEMSDLFSRNVSFSNFLCFLC